MSKLNWYVHRLKAMSAGEVAWRARQRAKQALDLRKYSNRDWPITSRERNLSAICIFAFVSD